MSDNNETFTYYYETYGKIDGRWFIQTMDNAWHRLRTYDSGGILIPEPAQESNPPSNKTTKAK